MRAAAAQHPAVVVRDIGLPDLSGIEVLKVLRGWMTAPVLVRSGRTDPRDKLAALDAGADDYLTKPFDMEELLARLRAAVRRAGSEVRLTPTEWSILEMLVRNRGRLVNRESLLNEVRGPLHEAAATNYLRVYLAHLRRKLDDDPSHPSHLLTEAGMGYRFRQ